ncbi:MAG: hypothetical protein MK074_08710, partial [Phycisphaerales bacterium]|nr:hypothetical protein [Phycisphaerales bacterium]
EDDFGEGAGFNRDWARVAHDSGLWWHHDRYAMHHRVIVDEDIDPCEGDTNADDMVDTDDLLTVLAQWGSSGAGDVNGDGIVNVNDILVIVSAWGPCA